jgi:Big-like domain-containing protein
MVDPNFPGCNWQIPAGSADPFAYQLKAVASLGDGCPTLDLVYAAPLNMVTNAKGLPIDASGRVIDRDNPRGLPQFLDRNGNGDLYDDAFLMDTRLRPLPHAGATVSLDRYSVVIPPGAAGPVAVTAAVYYQSVEAIVAKKFLGNLADTNTNFVLEPCALGGPCDGRRPSVEPAVVEGAPPVPMEVRNWVIQIDGGDRERVLPRVMGTYPRDGATAVFQDVVIKAFFSRPVRGVDHATFTLADAKGRAVPASVDQIGDGTWGLFPASVFLAGETYTARLASGLCDESGDCTTRDVVWRFTVSGTRGEGAGDTTIPIGFPPGSPRAPAAPAVNAVNLVSQVTPADTAGSLQIEFSKPVMNVTPRTLEVRRKGDRARECSAADPKIAGDISSNRAGDLWTFRPHASLEAGAEYCVSVSGDVYDLSGNTLERSLRTHVKVGDSRR